MRYFQISGSRLKLSEAAIPDTDYGYWLDDNGVFHPVGIFAHLEHVRKMGHSYVSAYRNGWVRIVARSGISINFDIAKIHRRTMFDLRRLMSTLDDKNIEFEDADIDRERDDQFSGTFKSFPEFAEHIRYAMSKLNVPVLVESIIPASTYGFWISPEGECVPVSDLETHGRVLMKNFRLHMTDAFHKGWVRVISHRMNGVPRRCLEIELTPSAITNRALSALRRLAVEGGYDDFAIDDADKLDGQKGRSYLISNKPVAEFINYLKGTAHAD